jgi:hypothetical protein
LNVATKFLDRWSSFLLAFGVVMCLESLCTIEWSFPYCSSQEDGPAAAVFGLPFPYIRWAGASLGVDSPDIAFVHDISPDFAYFPNGWEEQYEIARKGAFPALSKMRDEGIIRAWGIGVNTPQPILKVLNDADPDVCLCARQNSFTPTP